MKRVAVKYCGGCNPSYDRVRYVERVRGAAGDQIEWVSLEADRIEVVLVVGGCDRQCVEGVEYEKAGLRVVRLRDGRAVPEEVVGRLLEQRKFHENSDSRRLPGKS